MAEFDPVGGGLGGKRVLCLTGDFDITFQKFLIFLIKSNNTIPKKYWILNAI